MLLSVRSLLSAQVVSNFNAIDDNKSLMYDINTMSKVFKDFFWNLAASFVVKFPDLSNKYNLEHIFLYYSNFVIPEVIHIKSTLEENAFKIMENIEISKLPGGFLKDGAKILSKPISEIYSLSISHGIFPNTCKVSKLKPIFKKGKKVDPSNYRPISLLLLISKTIKILMTKSF